jgi:hypothetical protein
MSQESKAFSRTARDASSLRSVSFQPHPRQPDTRSTFSQSCYGETSSGLAATRQRYFSSRKHQLAEATDRVREDPSIRLARAKRARAAMTGRLGPRTWF